MQPIRLKWIWAFWITCFLPFDLHATEPQIAFKVEDGWVHVSLEHDGNPVAGAILIIRESQGKLFAEGETSAEGKATFPLPPGSIFLIEIRIGERNADPIFMTKVSDDVVPTQVLLSFGLKACCLPKTTSTRPDTFSISLRAVGAILFLLAGTVILILSRHAEPGNQPHKRKRS